MDHMSDTNVAPAGYAQLSLFFAVNRASAALDFYRDVFGAAILVRMEAPDGTIMHAELEINGVRFQLSDAMPAYGIASPPAEGNAFTVTLWTPDPDGVFARAVAAGATPLSEVADVFSGDRMGVVRCPFGVRWAICRHDRDVPVAEIEAAALSWSS